MTAKELVMRIAEKFHWRVSVNETMCHENNSFAYKSICVFIDAEVKRSNFEKAIYFSKSYAPLHVLLAPPYGSNICAHGLRVKASAKQTPQSEEVTEEYVFEKLVKMITGHILGNTHLANEEDSVTEGKIPTGSSYEEIALKLEVGC